MEQNLTQLCDLDPMKDDTKILVRCISIWKSHPLGKPNEVWSLDAVLQDEQGNRVQATIKGKHISKFQLLLDEGACYRIGNLGVGENSGKWPLLNHKFKLNFFQGTTVTRVGSFDNNPHGFKFEHFTSFTSRTFKETELCDVIGTVVSVSDAIPFNNYGKDQLRRTIILEDVQGAQLECCFFYAWCNKFAKLHDERESMGHVVMILQLCKVKYFNGVPSVGPAMYSTKLYLNDDIHEIAAFKYSEKDGFDPANHTIALFTPVKKEVTADDFFKGAIKKTVGSIRDSDGPYHCLLYAKIHKIHRENGWTYLACKKCGRSAKEVDFDESSSSSKRAKNQQLWNCRIHKGLTASLVHMRFKVIVRVIDDTGSASLLLFDDLVFKLTNGEQCHKLIEKHGPNYDDYFPSELNVLVGKTVLWRFKYTDDHIQNNNYLYQINLLSVDEAMVTRFKQDFILEDAEDDLHTPVLGTANSSRFSNVANIPFNIEESPNSVDGIAQGSGTNLNCEGSSSGAVNDGGNSGSGKRTIINLDDFDEEAAIAKRLKQPIIVKLEPKD
ncbi:replication protein A 70 kDa DNA-binding subunit B [Tanacetum coccineum]